MTEAVTTAPQSATAPAPAAPAREPVLRGVGVALILLGVFVLGFAGYLYGLSGVQEGREQSILFQQLQLELANQVSPLGPTTAGSPVAVLNIPAIGVQNMVVVEGTSPESLSHGPGLLRDTALPGQAGVSEIFGRRATFGAPFGRLTELRPGDVIDAITGQGTSTYRVVATGSSQQAINDPDPDRLVLLTASSPVIPSYYVDVDARLTSAPYPGPPVPQVIDASEPPLAGDSGALGLVMVWGEILVLVSVAGTLAVVRWSRWPAYLVIAPVLLAVLWNLYQALAMLLPNVY
jgi:sortase A